MRTGIQPSASIQNRQPVRNFKEKLIRFYIANEGAFNTWHNTNWSDFEARYAAEEAALKAYYASTEPAALAAERQRLLGTSTGAFAQATCKDILPTGRDKWQELFEFSEKTVDLIVKATSPTSTPEESEAADSILTQVEAARSGSTAATRFEGFQVATTAELITDLNARSTAIYNAFSNFTISITELSTIPLIYIGTVPDAAITDMRNSANLCSRFQLTKTTCADIYFRVAQMSTDTYKAFIINAGKTLADDTKCAQSTNRCEQDLSQGIIDTNPDASIDRKRIVTYANPSKSNNVGNCDDELTLAYLLLIPNAARNYLIRWVRNRTERLVEYYYKDAGDATITTKKGALRDLAPATTVNFTRKANLNALAQFFYERLNGLYAMTYIYDMSTVGNSVVDIRFDVTVHGDPVAIYNRIEALTQRYLKFTQANIASSIRDEARMRYVEKLYELQDEQDRNIRRTFKGLIGRFFYENVGGMPVIRGFTLEPTAISSYIPAKNGGFSIPLRDAPGNISYAPMTNYTINPITPLNCTDLAQLRMLMEEYRDSIYSDDLSARLEQGEPVRGQFFQNPGGTTYWVPAGGSSKYVVGGTVECNGVNVATEAKAATDAELNAISTNASPFKCSMLYDASTGWDLSGQLVLKSILASQQLGDNQCAVKWTETILDPGTNKPVEGKSPLITRRAILTYKTNSDFWMANNRVLDISGFAFLPSDTGGECKFDATQYKAAGAFKTAYTTTGLAKDAALCRSVAPDVKYSPFVYRDINTDVIRRAGYDVSAITHDFRTNLETVRLSKAWNLTTNNMNYTYPTNIPYEAMLTTREDRCPVRSCSDTEVLYAIADDINQRNLADFKVTKITKAVTANSQQCDLEMQIQSKVNNDVLFGLSDDGSKLWFLSPIDKKKYELRNAESVSANKSINFCFNRLTYTNIAKDGEPDKFSFSHISRTYKPGNAILDRDFPTASTSFACTQLYNLNEAEKTVSPTSLTYTEIYPGLQFVRYPDSYTLYYVGLADGNKYEIGAGSMMGNSPSHGNATIDYRRSWANEVLSIPYRYVLAGGDSRWERLTGKTYGVAVIGKDLLDTLPTVTNYTFFFQGTYSDFYYRAPGSTTDVRTSLDVYGSTGGTLTRITTLPASLFITNGTTLWFMNPNDSKRYIVNLPAASSSGDVNICYNRLKFTNTAAAGQPVSLRFSHSLLDLRNYGNDTNNYTNINSFQEATTPFDCSLLYTISPTEKPLTGTTYASYRTERRAVTIAVDPETCDISVDKIGNDGTADFIQSTTPDLPTPFQYTTEAVNAEGGISDIKSSIATVNQAVHTAVSGPIFRYGTETERLKTIIIGEAAGVTQIQTPPDLLRTPMHGVRFTFLTARNSTRAGISAVFLYRNNALIDMYGATISIDGKPDMSVKALALKPANYMARTSFTPDTVVSFPTPWSVTIALERPTLIDSFSFSTGNDTNEDPISWRVEATFLASAQVEAFQNVAEGRTNWVTVQEKILPTSQSLLGAATLPPLSTLVILDAVTDTNKKTVETAYATLTQKFTAYKAAPSPALDAEISALLATINRNSYPSRGYYVAPRQSLLPNVPPQIQQQSPLRPKSAAECESFAWHPETIKRISDNIYNTMNTALFKYIGRNYLQQLTSYAINSDTYTFYMKTRLLNVAMDGAKQTRDGPTYALKFEQATLCDYKPIPTSFRRIDQPLRTGVRYIRVKPVYGDETFVIQKSISAGYAYSWNNANQIASDMGLRLASWAEMSRMVDEQGQFCSWAWTSDKRMGFPNYERANHYCGTQRKTVTTNGGYLKVFSGTELDTVKYNAALYGRKPHVPSVAPTSASATNGWVTQDLYIGQFYDTGLERENPDRTIFLQNGNTVRDTTKYNHILWSKWQLRLSQIAILSAETGQNIALGKTVRASSTHVPDNGAGLTQPCSASKVVDGTYTPRFWKDGFVTDINTLAKWKAAEDEYIEVDLGSEQTISKVVLFAPWGQAYLRYTVEAYDANRNLVAQLGEEATAGQNKVYTLDADTYTPPESAYIPYPALQTALFKHPTDTEVVPNEMVLQRIPDCIQRNVFRVNTFYVIDALCRLFSSEYSKLLPGYTANPVPKIRGRAFLSGIHGFFIDTLTNSIVIQPKYFIVGSDLAVTPCEQLSDVPVYYKLYFDPVPSCPPQIMTAISRPGVEQFRYIRLSGFSMGAQSGNTIEIGKLNLLLDGANIRSTQGIFFSGFTMTNTDGSTRQSTSSSVPTTSAPFTSQITVVNTVPYGVYENTRWGNDYRSYGGVGNNVGNCQEQCDADTNWAGGLNTDGSIGADMALNTPQGNVWCTNVVHHPTHAGGACWHYGDGYRNPLAIPPEGVTGGFNILDNPATASISPTGFTLYRYPQYMRLHIRGGTAYATDYINNRIISFPITNPGTIDTFINGNTVSDTKLPQTLSVTDAGHAYVAAAGTARYRIVRISPGATEAARTGSRVTITPNIVIMGVTSTITLYQCYYVSVNRAGTILTISDLDGGRAGQVLTGGGGQPTGDGAVYITRNLTATGTSFNFVQVPIYKPTHTVITSTGLIYVSSWKQYIAKIDANNTLSAFVGSADQPGTRTSADDGVGAAARFVGIRSIALDDTDILYVCEDLTEYTLPAPIRRPCARVRRVSPDGTVTTLIPNIPFYVETIAVHRAGNTLSVYITSAFRRNIFKVDIPLSAADPSMLFNPDPSTFWTENATGLRSLTLDLGGPVAANQLSLSTSANPTRFPAAMTVQVSPDGSTWRTVASATFAAMTTPETRTTSFQLKVPEYNNQFQPFPAEVAGKPPTSQMPYGWGGFSLPTDLYIELPNMTLQSSTLANPTDYFDPIDGERVSFAAANPGLNAQKEVANLSKTGAILSIERSVSQTPPTLFSVTSATPPVTRFYALGDTSNRIISQQGTTLLVKDQTYRVPVASEYLFNSIRFTALRTRDPSSSTYTIGKLAMYWSNSEAIPMQVTSIRKLNNASFNAAIQAKQQQVRTAEALPSTPANLVALAGLRSELESLLQQQAIGVAGTAQELTAAQALFTYTNEDQLTLSKSDAPDGFILEFALPIFAYGFSFTTGTANFIADLVQWQLDIKMPSRSWRTVERMTVPYAVPQERGVQLPIFDFRGDIQLLSSSSDPLRKKTITSDMLTNPNFIEAIQTRLLQYRGLTATQISATPYTNPCNITEMFVDEFNNKIFITTDDAVTHAQRQYAFSFPTVYGDVLQRLAEGTLGTGSIEEITTTDPTPLMGPTSFSLGTGGTNYPYMRIIFLNADDSGPEVQLHKIFLMNDSSTQSLVNTNFYVRSGTTVSQNTTNIPNMFSSALVVESNSFIRPSPASSYLGSIFIHCTSTSGIPINSISVMNGLNGQKRPRSIRIQISKNGILWETCYMNGNLNIFQPRSFATHGGQTNSISRYLFADTIATNLSIPAPTVTAPTTTDINTFMKNTYSRVFVPAATISYNLPYPNTVLYGFQSRSGEFVYQYVSGTTRGTPVLISNHPTAFMGSRFGIVVTTTTLKTIKNFPITTFTDNTAPSSQLVDICRTRWATTTSEPLNILGAVSDENTNTVYFRIDTATAPTAKEYVGFVFDPVLWTSATFAQFNAATQPPIAFMNTYDVPPIPVNIFPVTNGFKFIRFTPTKIRNNTTAEIQNLILWRTTNNILPSALSSPILSTTHSAAQNTGIVYTLNPNDGPQTANSITRDIPESILARTTPYAQTGRTSIRPGVTTLASTVPLETRIPLLTLTIPNEGPSYPQKVRFSLFVKLDIPVRSDMAFDGLYFFNLMYVAPTANIQLEFGVSVTNPNTAVPSRGITNWKVIKPKKFVAYYATTGDEVAIEAERQKYLNYDSVPVTLELNTYPGDIFTFFVYPTDWYTYAGQTSPTNTLDTIYRRSQLLLQNVALKGSYSLTFPTTIETLSAYSFTTNATNATKDPVSWRVEGSRDNTTWSLIHRVSNQAMPDERSCDLPKFFFPMFAVRDPEPRSPCFYPAATTFSSCGLTCTSNPYLGMITTDLGATTRNTSGATVAFPAAFGTTQTPSNPANIYGVAFDPVNQQCIYDYYPTTQPTQRKRATYKFNTTNLQCTGAGTTAFDTTGKDLTKLFSFTKESDTVAPGAGQADTAGFIAQPVELSSAELFQFIRFVPLKTSNSAVTNVRISKLLFLTPTGSIYTFPAGTTVTSPSNPSNTSSQNVYYTGSESLASEWSDTALAVLQYTIPAPGISLAAINSFSIIVGSVPSQAPIQWRLEASSDQILWKRLHLQTTDLSAPTQVQQSYPRFYFDTSLNSQQNSRKITEPTINKTCASSDILTAVSKALLNQLTPIYFNPSLYSYVESKNTCYYKQQDGSYIRAVLFTDVIGRTTASSTNTLYTLASDIPNPTTPVQQLTTVESLNPLEPALLEVVRDGYGTTHPLILTDYSKDSITNSMIYQFDRKFCPENFKLTPYLQVTLPIKAATPYTPDDIRRDGSFASKLYLRSQKATGSQLYLLDQIQLTGDFSENDGRFPNSKELAQYTFTTPPAAAQFRVYTRADLQDTFIRREGVQSAQFNIEVQIVNAAGTVVSTNTKSFTNPTNAIPLRNYPVSPDITINRTLGEGEYFRVMVSRNIVPEMNPWTWRVSNIGVKIDLLGSPPPAAISPVVFTPLPYTSSRFVRIFFSKLRFDQAETLAIDSFQFFNVSSANGQVNYTQVTPVSAQNPGGSADMSKSPIIDTARQAFLFEFATGSYPNGFSFKTYSESPNTDPIRWVVQTSQDGMAWYKAYEQNEDAPILDVRKCQQPIYIFNYANLGASYGLDGCSEPQKVLGTCSKSCTDPDVIATLNAKFREVNQISDVNSYKILGYGDDSGNNKCTMSYITPRGAEKQGISVGNEVTLLEEKRATFTINPTTGLCRNIRYNMTQDNTANTGINYGPRTLQTASKVCDSTDILQMVAQTLNSVFVPLSYDFNATTNTCVYKLQDEKVLSVSFFTSLMNELYIRSMRLSSPGSLPALTPVTEGRVKSVDECVPAGVLGHEKAITSLMINAVNSLYTAKYGAAYPLRIKKYGYDEANKRCIYDLWEDGLPQDLDEFRRIALAVEVKYNGDCTPTGTLIAPFRNLTLPTVEMTGLGTSAKPYRYLLIDQIETRNPDAAAVKIGKLTFGSASGTTYTPHPELATTTVTQTGILKTSEITTQLTSTEASSKTLPNTTFTEDIASTNIKLYLKANLDSKFIIRDYATVSFQITVQIMRPSYTETRNDGWGPYQVTVPAQSKFNYRYYLENPTTNPNVYPTTSNFSFPTSVAKGDYLSISIIRRAISGLGRGGIDPVATINYPVQDIGIKFEYEGLVYPPNPNYWSVTNPQGSYVGTLQKSIALLDSTSQTAPYTDPQKKGILIDTLQTNKQLTAYSFTTAREAGSSDSDPVKWKLYASQDSYVWQLVDNRGAEQPVSLERGCNQRVWTISSSSTPFLRDSCADTPKTFRECNKQCTDPDMLPTFINRFYSQKGIPAGTPVEQSPLNIRKLGYSSSEAGGDQCIVEYDNAVTGQQGRLGFIIMPTRKFCDEAAKPFNIELNESTPPLDTVLAAFPATPNESYQYLRFRFTKLRGETATYAQASKLFLFTAAGRFQQTFTQGTAQVTRLQQGASLFTSGEPTNASAANLQDYDTYDSIWESTSGPGTVLVKLAAPMNTLTGFSMVAGPDPSRLPTQWVVEYFSTAQNVWKVLHSQATDIDRRPVAFQSYPIINFNGQVATSPMESYFLSSVRNTVAATDANCTSAVTAQAILDAYASRQINIEFNPVAYRLDPNNTVVYKLASGLVIAVDINLNTAGQTVVRTITHNPGVAEPTTAYPTTVLKGLATCIGSGNPCLNTSVLNTIRAAFISTNLGIPGPTQSYPFTFIGYAYDPITNMCIYELDPYTRPPALRNVTTIGFVFERTTVTPCSYRLRGSPLRDPTRTVDLVKTIPFAADNTFKFTKLRFIPTMTRSGGSKVSVGKFSFFSRDAEAFTVKEGFAQLTGTAASDAFDANNQCKPGYAGFLSRTNAAPFPENTISSLYDYAVKTVATFGTTPYRVCVKCITGNYCPGGDTYPWIGCYGGGYCPTITSRVLCGAGTYNDVGGQTQSSACKPCPTNSSCPQGTEIFTCNAGFFRNGTQCSQCPANTQSCTSLTTFTCSSGYYKDGTQCTPCPQNSQSCVAGSTTFICNAGYYKNGNQCTPCPPGTINPTAGATSSTQCIQCPANSSCAEGSATFICNSGFYKNGSVCTQCPANTASCTSPSSFTCLAAYYSNGTQCIICPENSQACPQGSTTFSCNGGYYKNGSACSPCPAGSFCAPGSTAPTPCPPGAYCPPKSSAAGTATPPLAGPHTFTATSRDIAGTTATDISGANTYNIANFYITADPNQPWTSDSLQPVMFNFPAAATLVGFSFTTSTRSADEDPVQWRIQGSADGTYWVDIHTQYTDFATSTTRSCDQPRIFFDFENTPNQPRNACASGLTGAVAGFQDYKRGATRKVATSPLKEGFGRLATPASTLTAQFKPLLKQPAPAPPAEPIETQRSIETYEDKQNELKPTQHKFLRFRPLKTRAGSHPVVQVASFSIETPTGPMKPSRVRVTNPMGTWKGESTELMGGGATGWTDAHKSALIFAFRDPTTVTGFRFTTGPEAPADPVRWKVEVSTNGTYWETLVDQSKSDFRVPTKRGETIKLY